METPIRVILAEDHAIVRQGTVELLRREPDLDIVGEAGDGKQAVELALLLRPDVVVMDIRMPELSGIEAARQIRAALPHTQVLVLSAYDDDQFVISALQVGASGYLLKSATVSELVTAIHQVQAGETPLDPAIARKVIAGLPNTAGAPAQLVDITPRERDILRLLAKGMSNRAIAEALFISERTVQTHLTSLFAKMQASSRLDAVVIAARRGWITLEP